MDQQTQQNPQPALVVEMSKDKNGQQTIDPQLIMQLFSQWKAMGGESTANAIQAEVMAPVAAKLLRHQGLHEEAALIEGKEYKAGLVSRFESVMNSKPVRYGVTLAVVAGVLVVGLRFLAKTFDFRIPLISPNTGSGATVAEVKPMRTAASR